MLITKIADVTWNSRNKKYYTNLGYTFSKMGESFSVDINDLTCGSQAFVELKCDYCGDIFSIQWVTYNQIKRKEIIRKDACKKCCELKSKESIVQKYGGYDKMYALSNDKRTSTNIEKYGFPNPFSNSDVQSKIINTNIKKYGVLHNQQCALIRSKTENTCLERYGVNNYVELFKGKFIGDNSPVWKGGVEHTRTERANHDYINWRKCVFAKDKYTCVKCGAHSVELNAHHIYNWKDFPDRRYAVDNGITLCSECHNKFHSIFGKRYNNESQLTEFLLNR